MQTEIETVIVLGEALCICKPPSPNCKYAPNFQACTGYKNLIPETAPRNTTCFVAHVLDMVSYTHASRRRSAVCSGTYRSKKPVRTYFHIRKGKSLSNNVITLHGSPESIHTLYIEAHRGRIEYSAATTSYLVPTMGYKL